MLTAGSLEEGSLAARLPKLPSKPLNQFQANQARKRLQEGETIDNVAKNLGVEVELVRKLRA